MSHPNNTIFLENIQEELDTCSEARRKEIEIQLKDMGLWK